MTLSASIREAAINKLAAIGAWCGVCELRYDCEECRRVREAYVDAVASVLAEGLMREVAALRQERDIANEMHVKDVCRIVDTEAQLAAAREANARMLESLRTIAHLLQNPADAGHLLNGGNAFKLARDTYIAESDATRRSPKEAE